MQYTGSCHCGQLKFAIEADIKKVVQCNCSICRRKGYRLWFTSKAAAHLVMPEGSFGTYWFNKHQLAHHFCKTCGCAPFSIGIAPGGSEESAAINLNCLDEELSLDGVEVVHYDGKNI